MHLECTNCGLALQMNVSILNSLYIYPSPIYLATNSGPRASKTGAPIVTTIHKMEEVTATCNCKFDQAPLLFQNLLLTFVAGRGGTGNRICATIRLTCAIVNFHIFLKRGSRRAGCVCVMLSAGTYQSIMGFCCTFQNAIDFFPVAKDAASNSATPSH